MKKIESKKGFFRRLIGCERGDGVVEKIVLVGLAITAAAGSAKAIQAGTQSASQMIAQRAVQGGAGVAPTGN